MTDAVRATELTRPSWDEYFMEIARVVASRSTCPRRQVGAVVVRDRRLLSSGYNGAPSGLPHCTEMGCLLVSVRIGDEPPRESCQRAAHAEANAIAQAALHGVSTQNATLYCTDSPCTNCAKLLINAGVIRLVFVGEYPDELGRQMLADAGVDFEQRAPVASAAVD